MLAPLRRSACGGRLSRRHRLDRTTSPLVASSCWSFHNGSCSATVPHARLPTTEDFTRPETAAAAHPRSSAASSAGQSRQATSLRPRADPWPSPARRPGVAYAPTPQRRLRLCVAWRGCHHSPLSCATQRQGPEPAGQSHRPAPSPRLAAAPGCPGLHRLFCAHPRLQRLSGAALAAANARGRWGWPGCSSPAAAGPWRSGRGLRRPRRGPARPPLLPP
jgi:hypothetical protein